MKLADYVITYLRDKGIKQVFQVYGAATGDLIDAFSRVEGIEYICVIHEQAGSFAVEAYSRVMGYPTCFIATSGPGGINVLNGIANAYYESIPCIFITGQTHSKYLCESPTQRQVGFQENDIVSMAKPITKYAVAVREPSEIRHTLDKAFYLALKGRQGPVLVDIASDLQKVDIEPETLEPFTVSTSLSYPFTDNHIERLVQDLKQAKRPVILGGGGLWSAHAAREVLQLGNRLKVPCFPTWNACDIFTTDYPYYRGRVGTYGGPGRNFGIQNSDLLLAIGTKLSVRITSAYVESFARGAKKYIVNIDPTLFQYNQLNNSVNILCDAQLFIQKLLRRLKDEELPDWSDWLDKTKEWLDKYQPCLPEYFSMNEYVHPYIFIKALSEECTPNDVIIVDCGGNAVVTFQAFETKFGQRLFSSNGNSPMGFAFGGGIGASFLSGKVSTLSGFKPINNVICLIGDGGFQMNLQELQTVKCYDLNLKTFIMNNHCYGITHQFQDTNYEGRRLASGPDGYTVPDFIKISEAYGIHTEAIESRDDLRWKIRKVLRHPRAVVCDVDMGMHCSYIPRIFGWHTPIEDMYPYLSRKEFRENMIIEPVEDWQSPVIPGKASGTGLA